MIIVIATAVLYLACVIAYHANKKRSSIAKVRSSSVVRLAMHLLTWLLLIAGLILVVQVSGWERGIPIWLCLLTLTGITSLLISALCAKYHIVSAALATSVIAIFGLISI